MCLCITHANVDQLVGTNVIHCSKSFFFLLNWKIKIIFCDWFNKRGLKETSHCLVGQNSLKNREGLTENTFLNFNPFMRTAWKDYFVFYKCCYKWPWVINNSASLNSICTGQRMRPATLNRILLDCPRDWLRCLRFDAAATQSSGRNCHAGWSPGSGRDSVVKKKQQQEQEILWAQPGFSRPS